VYFVVPPGAEEWGVLFHFFSPVILSGCGAPSLDDLIRRFSAFLLCDLSVLLFHFYRIIRSVGCDASRAGCSCSTVFYFADFSGGCCGSRAAVSVVRSIPELRNCKTYASG